MKLEKGVISSSQLIFLIGFFFQGTLYSVTMVFQVVSKDAWLVSLTAFIFFIIFALAYIKLLQQFPGKNLIELNDLVYGRFLSKVISGLYILFFVLLATGNLRFLGDYVVSNFMPETPMIAIAIMFMIICAWVVRSGLEVLARVGLICFAIVLIFTVFSQLVLIPRVEINNFLPVLNIPLMDFVRANHILITGFYGELLIFLMVIPYMSQIKPATKSVLLGTVIGALALFITAAEITGVLGNYSMVVTSPVNALFRQVAIGTFLIRVEFVVASTLMFSVFIKLSVIYYATTLGISQMFNLRSYQPLVVPIGIVFLSLVVPLYDTPIAIRESVLNTWPFIASIIEILPVVTLLVAMIRGLPQKQGGEC